MKSLQRRIVPWIFAASMLSFGSVMAQSEPSLAQVYEVAQSGQLDKAQLMMQQVLVAHPNSAKAHFVQAELFGRQGNLTRAQEELATAEKLAPGLPFAKPDAIQHLRGQIAAKSNQISSATGSGSASNFPPVMRASPSVSNPPASSFPWGMALGLGGAALALYLVLNRRKAVAVSPPPVYGAGNGLSGPQTFGTGNATPSPYGQPGYAPNPQAVSGMGSKIAGGLATGLAVGAGMMAANAIGKTLMGNDEHTGHRADSGNDLAGFNSPPQNGDMGGQNFGVQDAGGWDDAGGGVDAGGDWDN